MMYKRHMLYITNIIKFTCITHCPGISRHASARVGNMSIVASCTVLTGVWTTFVSAYTFEQLKTTTQLNVLFKKYTRQSDIFK
jgi:hypothetical protein